VEQQSEQLPFRQPQQEQSHEHEQQQRVPGCLRRFFFSQASLEQGSGLRLGRTPGARIVQSTAFRLRPLEGTLKREL
jgi:hypothetical protein